MIQKYIEDIIAEEIINNKLKEGDNIILDVNKVILLLNNMSSPKTCQQYPEKHQF